MQIMTVLGSPRKEGNTAKVMAWVEEQFQADGHQVDRADITDYAVAGCRECFACKKGDIEFCAVKDDGNALFERMVAADGLLLGAPLFCWGFPAQLKALVDRMFCLMGDVGSKDYVTRLQGKTLGLVLTAGAGEEGNGEFLLRPFDAMAGFMQAKAGGHLFVPWCTGRNPVRDEVKVQAIEFARQFARA